MAQLPSTTSAHPVILESLFTILQGIPSSFFSMFIFSFLYLTSYSFLTYHFNLVEYLLQ